VDAVLGLAAAEAILEGEAIALRPDGTPHPFQTTMRRFGRRLDVETVRESLPLTLFLFDLLQLDGEPLLDEPLGRRAAILAELVPASLVVPRMVTGSVTEASEFLQAALARGHEGIMVKALDSPYEAGRRGRRWLKVKPVRTLDLVVLAAEWGHGRRRGWLSNIHLGAREGDGFVMLGKTFKGMTDEMLAWQTTRLQELEAARDGHVVYVRPELVVEVAFNDLQASPQYPGGLALRFARVKGYRPDKAAADADTMDTLREIYRRQTGLEPPSPYGPATGRNSQPGVHFGAPVKRPSTTPTRYASHTPKPRLSAPVAKPSPRVSRPPPLHAIGTARRAVTSIIPATVPAPNTSRYRRDHRGSAIAATTSSDTAADPASPWTMPISSGRTRR
jgi:hypothetical protein